LLLPFADALYLEYVSRLPRKRRLAATAVDVTFVPLHSRMGTSSSMRVDHFIANSKTVAASIKKYYRRNAAVIHPPVAIDQFESVPASDVEDYYLSAGELVAYKKPELAVEACNSLGRRLVVIGGGELLAKLRKLAGPTVTVLGPQPFQVLRITSRAAVL
jgi:glycosyltransferase involved in cell wall biosynthesis